MSDGFFSTAIILAGGKGTRLRPAVADRPKPLAWVAGRPFLSYLLEDLESAGFRRCILATGHLGGQFQERYGKSFGALELLYSQESVPLGTGGAVGKAVEAYPGDETLVVLNGDSLCRCDWRQLWEKHHRAAVAATMVVTPSRASARFGEPLCDTDGRITAFAPSAREHSVLNAGVYAMDGSLCREIPGDRMCSIEQDLFPVWSGEGRLQSLEVDGPLLDIGLPESFAFAQSVLRRPAVVDFATRDDLCVRYPEAVDLLAERRMDEINKWKLAVGVIVRNVRGDILLERRTDCGLWGLLGGRMDFGESARDTALREVREETGLQVSLERLVGVYSNPDRGLLSYPGGDIVHCVTIVFEASVGQETPACSEESLELRFFNPTELPRDTIPQAQQCLIDCLEKADTACL